MIKKVDFKNDIWNTPYIVTIPAKVEGVENSSVLLSERDKADWQFCFNEADDIPNAFSDIQDYNFDCVSEDSWQNVIVPGSLIMQGFNIQNNCEYYYKRKITIPSDFNNKRVYIKFEGVYSNARVWINNKFVKQHTGGFTVWDCDISDFVGMGDLTLIVGVTDIEGDKKCPWNPDGIKMSNSAWASYYAHCNICGILRNVTLFALPQNYIARNHINTTFSKNYTNADLNVSLEVHSSNSNIELIMDLIDDCDLSVKSECFKLSSDYISSSSLNHSSLDMIPPKMWKLKNSKSYKNDCLYSKYHINSFSDKPLECEVYAANISMNVENPKLWDAEHPNLYKLKITLKIDNIVQQTNTYDFGFREITYGGKNATDKNKVYINGLEIKLRGVCRHDVSHIYGRSITDEDVIDEILAYKQNNINHIRTSHYPASDYLLSVCDKLGIYVEQENPACFKGANNFGVYNAPQDFVDTFAEMIESSRNHPSVIIWSIANESGFEKSYAFRTEYNYVKCADITRPVIFSFPHTIHSKPAPYDIFSAHYDCVTGKLGRKDVPMLHDEFAHISCYNLERLFYDNSSREAWGESIKKGWDNIFNTDGSLGCDLWASIDDVFYIPDNMDESHQSHSKGRCAGYGDWGCIFDAYKRKKPEAYLTKKAFSPIILDDSKTKLEKETTIYVENRFDHTHLNEIRMVCTSVKGKTIFDGFITEKTAPHCSGKITFPNPELCDVNISFYQGEYLVDEYRLTNKATKNHVKASSTKMFVELDNIDSLLNIKNDKGELIAKGPFFFIDGVKFKIKNAIYQNNVLSATAYCKNGQKFNISSEYKDGNLLVDVKAGNLFTSKKKFNEIGIDFILYNQIKSVTWDRNALYTLYPENHIGRNSGTAMLKRDNYEVASDEYGKKPSWNWEMDMQNYYLFSKSYEIPLATNDFKTKRNNIINYAVNFENGTNLHIETKSDNINGFVSIFKTPENQFSKLQITKGKNYADLAWGNYTGEKTALNAINTFSFNVSLVKYE